MGTPSSFESVLTFADVARTLNDFRPLEVTVERICERVTGLSGCDFAALSMPDERGDALVIRGCWGLSPADVDYIDRQHPSVLDETRQVGRSPTAEAYRGGHPVTLTDVELEPSFSPWKADARLQGYRSIACIPVVLRSQSIGVLTCYRREPHLHTGEEVELLQLVARLAGVAIETARIADTKQRETYELHELSDQLRHQNEELTRLSISQFRLVNELADPDGAALERTARTLAELIHRAVLVANLAGHSVAYVGPPAECDTMTLVAARQDVLKQVRQQAIVNVIGHTCLRIGLAERPLGILVLLPALEDDRSAAALLASQAAAVMAVELHYQRADRALETYARPAVLLALAHGLYPQTRFQWVAGVLSIPIDARLRVAVFRCLTTDAADTLSRNAQNFKSFGWPVIAVTPDGSDVIVLLHALDAGELRRAGKVLRDLHPEVERIGVSSTLTALDVVASGRKEGMTAAAVSGDVPCALFEDLGPFGELARDLPAGRVEEWVLQTLGPLHAYDAARGARLVEALVAYVRHQGRMREAADDLHVHPNTLYQRLRRGAELGRFDLHDFGGLAQVVLAVEWERMLRAAVNSDERLWDALMRSARRELA